MSNIRFNTSGLGSSQNSLYEVEKFNGVDYTTTPTAVDETRAIDASNYLPEGNGLVKRYGFEYYDALETTTLEGNIKFPLYDIKKIYLFKGYALIFAFTGFSTDDGEQLIPESIGASNDLVMYIADGGLTEIEDVTTNSYAMETEKSNYKDISFVEYGNCLYVFTGSAVWEIEYTTNIRFGFVTHELEVNLLSELDGWDSDIAYVPLIVNNIPPINNNGKALTLEQPNLLTSTVRVSLNFSAKLQKTVENSQITAAYTEKLIYKLGDYLPIGEMPEIKNIHTINDIRFQDYNSGFTNTYNDDNPLSPQYHKGIEAKESISVIIKNNNGEAKTVSAYRIVEFYAKDITDDNLKNLTKIKYVLNLQDYTILGDSDWYIQEEIEIGLDGFSTTNEIGKCDKAIYYDEKVFVYNSEKNVMYNSLTPNFPKNTSKICYFGSDTYQIFGDNSTGIVAAGVLNNGYMIVIKQSNQSKTNVYLRHKEYRNTVVDYAIGDIVYQYNKTEELYPIVQAGIDLDCDENTKTLQYDNKVIISAKKGIYYVNVDSSTATQTYNAYELSYMIRNDLSDDLSVNYLFAQNGMLYVIRKSKDNRVRVYVADKDRYTFVDGKMQYEWWVLDDYPIQDANDFICMFGTRTICTRNNVIADFDCNWLEQYKHFYDNFYSMLDASLITFTTKNETVDVDGVNENLIDYFALNLNRFDDDWTKEEYLEFKRTANFMGHTTDWEYEWDDPIKDLYYIEFNNSNVEVARYKIEDCELIDGYWYYTANNHFDLLGSKSSVKFRYFTTWRNVDDGTYVSYVNNDKYFASYYNSFSFQKPIKAYWKSKYTDLGATETLKTTSEVYFVPETRRGGAISIGYKTAKREKDFTRRKIILSRISETEKENLVNSQQFNFADVDFTDFHFETEEFAHSYSCKRKVKNFAFIQFKFYSNEPKDSTIVKFAVKYHKTRDSRGVR